MPRGIFSVADAGHQIVNLAQSITRGNLLQVFVFNLLQGDAVLARFFLDHLAANLNGPLALMHIEPMLDLVARARGLHQPEPVAAGFVARLGDDLDNVARMQLVTQRHHAAVDLGSNAGVPDFSVNGVGKVDRCSIARKHNNFAFRREGVNLFGIKIDFQRRKKFIGIADIALPLNHLPQPGKPLLVLRRDRAVFIFPVRCDAFLGHLVHLFGANLDFERRSVFCDDRGVQRLIEVGPRHGDEILDAPRHRTPDVVNDAQHCVAVLQRARDDAHGKQIVDLIDGNALALQLLVDRIQALDAALHLGLDAGLFQLVVDDCLHLREKSFALFAARIDSFFHLLVARGIEEAEAQILEFAANLAHAQAVGDGSVDLERLLGDLVLAFGLQVLERAHVVEAIGELDEHHADVINHGEHHLAQVLCLRLFAGGEVDLADLGDALDDVRNLLAEFLANVNDGDRGVFDRVVEQPGGDGDRVHLHIGEDHRNFQRMHQVRLTRGAGLAFVVFQGVVVGLLDDGQVVLRTVFLDPLHQLAELGERESGGRDLLAQARHVGLYPAERAKSA